MNIEALEKRLAEGHDDLLLRLGLGGEYVRRKDYEQAVPHLEAAVRWAPGHAAAWKLLGNAWTALGQTARARAAYEHGIEAAEASGHIQAAREMKVFLKRLDAGPRS